MAASILSCRSGLVAVIILGIVLFMAVFGPLLAPYDPYDSSFEALAGPTLAHLLGTDYLGRDVLSRLVYGSTLSVLGAVQVVLIGAVLGIVPGILSTFLGRSF
jgi:peptide/nickel transport system permease protein